MRIVEPRSLVRTNKNMPTKHKVLLVVVVLLSVVMVIGLPMILMSKEDNDAASRHNTNSNEITNKTTDEGVAADETVQKNPIGDEKYQSAWYALTIPDTIVPEVAPDLNNDTEFSRLVTSIAESRGYRLQKIYTGDNLVTYRGVSIEKSVLEPLQSLILEAAKEGMELSISSAYRTLEEQEYIFMSRYNQQRNQGKSQIEAINIVLEGAAPPGYSKHHSSYTIDMTCSGLGAERFIGTICDTWLSKNDYAKAKQYGFIPSYPTNIDVQGPIPEPWEYNYVGADVLSDINILNP